MASSFDQLIGAAGDVKELEYISALHQTDLNQVRQDCSIYAEDVRLFLMSRYGIKVTDEDVRQTIFAGMAGSDEQEECIDLMELVAMLLIPTLLKAAKQECGEVLPSDLVAPPTALLERVLHMILEDVTQSNSPKPLTRDLLKDILEAYGEIESAQNSQLLDEMIEAAAAGSSPSQPVLDSTTFAIALTSDVTVYHVNTEVLGGTNMNVYYQNHQPNTDSPQNANGERSTHDLTPSEEVEKKVSDRTLERKRTLPAIDLTAETYRSRALMIMLWTAILLTFFAYDSDGLNVGDSPCKNLDEYSFVPNGAWKENSAAIQCEVGASILIWMGRFTAMCIQGLLSALLGSVGNSAECHSALKPIFGGCYIAGFVIVRYVANPWNDSGDVVLTNASLAAGIITASMHFQHAYLLLSSHGGTLHRIGRLIPRGGPSSPFQSFKTWIGASNNAVFAEVKIKKSAACKLVTMTQNALDVALVKDKEAIITSHYGQALQAYSKMGRTYVEAGGFTWAWRRMLGRKSFADAGIWLPVRFVAGNVAQYIVAIYTLFAGISLTKYVSENYDADEASEKVNSYLGLVIQTIVDDEGVQALSNQITSLIGSYMVSQSAYANYNCDSFAAGAGEVIEAHCGDISNWSSPLCMRNTTDFLCALVSSQSLSVQQQSSLLQASGFNKTFLEDAVRSSLHKAIDGTVRSLYPTDKYMVVVPMAIATCLSFLVAMYLAVTYIPSVTTTILKLRCGCIPTLRDKAFFKYRVAADLVSMLTGSIFWGTFVSSVVVGSLVGLIVFFFLWQGSAYFAQRFVAILIGMVIIITIRILILLFCRCTMYRSFYRERPGAANLSMLALEWANFIVSAGFVLVRMAKLLLVAGASIGRIDTPFLAPGVGSIGPIELDGYPIIHMRDILSHELGLIYLTKLRYEKKFGTRAGCTWRLLFVYALMPWLHRYRVQTQLSRRGSEGSCSPEDSPDGWQKRCDDGDIPNNHSELGTMMST